MQWRVKEVNVNVNSCSSFHVGNFMGFFFIIITFWLHWVFIAVHGHSHCIEQGCSLVEVGFSVWWPLLL